MATAAGESASEMRTLAAISSCSLLLGCAALPPRWLRRLGERVLARGKCPVKPWRERFEIGASHGGAAPDTKAGRRIAVARYVECNTLFFEHSGKIFDECS